MLFLFIRVFILKAEKRVKFDVKNNRKNKENHGKIVETYLKHYLACRKEAEPQLSCGPKTSHIIDYLTVWIRYKLRHFFFY